ncbi:DUF2244 domain-containing protein [Caulobacter sp. NIBR2454]|uniref:DUF2244 domain-containing protein n=1 Tax=Caulobacter sp. NIBR2454 TaxID=3015996 RepID=UPI0022B629CD|nr:DUF2244 domain-containing protein [Caulobacter sp. NIBR2454]
MAATLYMDAVITQNRSLSPGGFKVLLGFVVAANVLFGIFLFVIGAWPVPIFLGLDVLAIWLAFKFSFRASERAERVQVSAEQVTVLRETPGRRRRIWVSPTAFTRVVVEQASEHDQRVRLRLSNKALTIAGSLSPDERGAFAQALEQAIQTARAERYPATQEPGGFSPRGDLV